LTYANVVATAALFMAMGSGAYAALGSSNHVFHGCVDIGSRVLRVIPSGRACLGRTTSRVAA
jgi:hypothetical protein